MAILRREQVKAIHVSEWYKKQVVICFGTELGKTTVSGIPQVKTTHNAVAMHGINACCNKHRRRNNSSFQKCFVIAFQALRFYERLFLAWKQRIGRRKYNGCICSVNLNGVSGFIFRLDLGNSRVQEQTQPKQLYGKEMRYFQGVILLLTDQSCAFNEKVTGRDNKVHNYKSKYDFLVSLQLCEEYNLPVELAQHNIHRTYNRNQIGYHTAFADLVQHG